MNLKKFFSSEGKYGECCVYMCTEENLVVLFHGYIESKELNVFWDASANIHFPICRLSFRWMCVSCGQRHANPRHQVTWVTKFCTVAPDIFGFSVWNLLHVTLLITVIVRWLLYFWAVCAPPLKVLMYFMTFVPSEQLAQEHYIGRSCSTCVR
jgi:hypothetical protein